MASIKPGPIRVLGQWMAAGMRVRVVTRHARGVRGVATGLLMAYDRCGGGTGTRQTGGSLTCRNFLCRNRYQ